MSAATTPEKLQKVKTLLAKNRPTPVEMTPRIYQPTPVDPQLVVSQRGEPVGRFPGMVEPGNITDLSHRPSVMTPEGDPGTVRSMSFVQNAAGPHTLVPTIADGRMLSDNQAEQRYDQTGQHLGKFVTPEDATRYAVDLHNSQQEMGETDQRTRNANYERMTNTPTVSQPPVSAPGSIQSHPYAMADRLEQEAQPPAPVQGVGRQLLTGVLEGMMAHSYGGYANYRAMKDAAELERQKTLLERAKQYRQMGMERERLNEQATAHQAEADYRQHSLNLQRQNVESESKYRDAMTQLERVKALREGRQPFIVPQGAAAGTVDENGTIQWSTPSPKASAPKPLWDTGVPVGIQHGDRTYPIGAPMPTPELQQIADSMIKAHKQRLQEQADMAAAAAERNDRLRTLQVPEQVKNQVNAAHTTRDMIKIVRGIAAAKPHLLGPAAGRMEQAAQGIGTSFGMQNPEDERDASTLAGHLAYLFANELRAAFPNRPNREVIEELKKASAQIEQNPNILEGMLRSAENNANVAIDGGKRWGIDLEAKTGSPASSKRIRVRSKATGKTGTLLESDFDASKYERIQ